MTGVHFTPNSGCILSSADGKKLHKAAIKNIELTKVVKNHQYLCVINLMETMIYDFIAEFFRDKNDTSPMYRTHL